MTRDETPFEEELARLLVRLGGAAPAGPGPREVLAALRRRTIRRGLGASAAACVVVATGFWVAWIVSADGFRPKPAPRDLAQGVAPDSPVSSRTGAGLAMSPPPLTFQASALAAVIPAPKTEIPPLSLPASLSAPQPTGGLDCRLPALSFALGRVKTQPTPQKGKRS